MEATEIQSDSKTLQLLRRLIADKQEIKKQMRKEYKNDPAIKRALDELNRLNNQTRAEQI
jgi:hypothetical protein